MNLSQWFHDQLQASAEGFAWAVDQVPAERRLLAPPGYLGDWSAARHVFHMLYYEQTIALPSMRQWLGDPPPPVDDLDEDGTWENGHELAELLAEFRKVRAEQITLLPEFDDVLWHAPRRAVWGTVTLRWVVTKTYQHTAEHTHDVLRLALFWR